MPRSSRTRNVRKICGCSRWRECSHAWYVWYRQNKRGLRCKLATLVGREPADYADAQYEARRAIIAWKEGRDAHGLLPGDAPTLATVLDAYSQRPDGAPLDRYQRGRILTIPVNGRPFGEWRAADVTRDLI